MNFPIYTKRKKQVFHVDHFESLFMGIVALPTKTLMLEQAISAVSCVYLGKVDNNDTMLQYGLQLYNSSIRHMSRFLTREACGADLAYTSMIFQEIEVHGLYLRMPYVSNLRQGHTLSSGSWGLFYSCNRIKFHPEAIPSPVTRKSPDSHYLPPASKRETCTFAPFVIPITSYGLTDC